MLVAERNVRKCVQGEHGEAGRNKQHIDAGHDGVLLVEDIVLAIEQANAARPAEQSLHLVV